MSWLENAAQGELRATALLLHGAGAPMDTDWMNQVAASLATEGVHTFRTEFRYMARRREDGKKRPPPKAEKLLPEVAGFMQHVRTASHDSENDAGRPIWLVGKSMGGRLATLYAAAPDCGRSPDQVVVLGYPFHPLGKPDRLRTDHLAQMNCHCRIIQGTRDPMGNRATVEKLPLPESVSITWVDKAGHDLKDLTSVTHSVVSELLK